MPIRYNGVRDHLISLYVKIDNIHKMGLSHVMRPDQDIVIPSARLENLCKLKPKNEMFVECCLIL